MADDRMKNDDLDRNMGGAGQQNKGDFGKQSPGRNPQDDMSTGKKGTGQGQGHEKEPRHITDDFGTRGKTDKSDLGKGGQNR